MVDTVPKSEITFAFRIATCMYAPSQRLQQHTQACPLYCGVNPLLSSEHMPRFNFLWITSMSAHATYEIATKVKQDPNEGCLTLGFGLFFCLMKQALWSWWQGRVLPRLQKMMGNLHPSKVCMEAHKWSVHMRTFKYVCKQTYLSYTLQCGPFLRSAV